MLKASSGNILKMKRRNNMKVKIFEATYISGLEREINKFFEENNIILINIKYSSCHKSESRVNHSAMIIYREDN